MATKEKASFCNKRKTSQVPPQDHQEYIDFVKKERKSIPGTLRVEIEPKLHEMPSQFYLDIFQEGKKETESKSDHEAIIPELIKEVLEDIFSSVRKRYQSDKSKIKEMNAKLPNYRDRSWWFKSLYGYTERDFRSGTVEVCRATESSVIKLIYLRQIHIIKCLEHHIEWLKDPLFLSKMLPRIYSLLVTLATPLQDDTSFILESLLRELLTLKKNPNHKNDVDGILVCSYTISLLLKGKVD